MHHSRARARFRGFRGPKNRRKIERKTYKKDAWKNDAKIMKNVTQMMSKWEAKSMQNLKKSEKRCDTNLMFRESCWGQGTYYVGAAIRGLSFLTYASPFWFKRALFELLLHRELSKVSNHIGSGARTDSRPASAGWYTCNPKYDRQVRSYWADKWA